MADPLSALQAGIEGALTGALSIPVYDVVPGDAPNEYVVIGDFRAMEMPFHGLRVEDVFCVLHVFSRYRGKKRVQEISAEIRTVLDEQPLALTTGFARDISVPAITVAPDLDGLTFTGRVDVRIILEH